MVRCTNRKKESGVVKKLKSIAAGSDKQLAGVVRDSAQQIWLAGLGAFAKAQEEGVKVFDALVREGKTLEGRTRRIAETRVGMVSEKVGKAATKATERANATWDKLEQVFEDRVARALNRLGVPTNKDIHALAKRVEELNENVRKLSGGSAPARVRKAAVKKRVAAKKTAGAK
jgi:poly(hydroxyalkanoate) granule-associated protein